MLIHLVRQRVRMAWNRVSRGPRRALRVVGVLVAVLFTAGFVILAGLNAAFAQHGRRLDTRW